jgi:hypothetical protein
MEKSIRYRGPRINLVGQRFGKLTVLSWAGNSSWFCRCECGRTTEVIGANLKRLNTRSCGCVRNAKASKRNTIHGLSKTRAYRTWNSVKRRCECPSYGKSYQQYGGKGIRMYPAWVNDPVAFINYIGQPPSDNYTLDRIDNTKGYFPGNIRWATPLEQGSNKANNRYVTYQGTKYTLSQLARKIASECGVSTGQFRGAFEKVIYKKTD